MEPCPLESTKRSRSDHLALVGLNFMWPFHNTSAMSAIPIGAPGCPELAFCTASILNARIALASSLLDDIFYFSLPFRNSFETLIRHSAHRNQGRIKKLKAVY